VGSVSFAVTDEAGRRRGFRARRVVPSASVLKAMLMVAYLNRSSVRSRGIRDRDRALLGPMIRRSDNATASRVLGLVGVWGVYRVARRAKMERFVLRLPIWGHSEITARDQARFFRRIDTYVPARHRGYARFLLAHVIRSQRWGIPPVLPDGYRIFFKGGWGAGTGRVTHQVALLEKGKTRISLAILTELNPSHRYGAATIRGIAARLLRGVR
jgi:beta-lactamase family protein